MLKCLNKLFWLCQDREYAWSFDMFDRLLKMPRVLNKPRFWIRHGCVRKGYAEFRICLIMVSYASIMPEYALLSLNMPEHGWILLNVPEYAWKCLNKLWLWLCFDYVRVLNMLRYSYTNIIIIIVNVVILKFLSARFVHPDALLPFYLF